MMTSSSEAAAGELVQLYIYDLSGGMARTFSQMLLGRQVRGRMSPTLAREATPAAPAVTPCCWRHLPPHSTAPHSNPHPLCAADRGHLAHRGGGGRHGAFLRGGHQHCAGRGHAVWAAPASAGPGVSACQQLALLSSAGGTRTPHFLLLPHPLHCPQAAAGR